MREAAAESPLTSVRASSAFAYTVTLQQWQRVDAERDMKVRRWYSILTQNVNLVKCSFNTFFFSLLRCWWVGARGWLELLCQKWHWVMGVGNWGFKVNYNLNGGCFYFLDLHLKVWIFSCVLWVLVHDCNAPCPWQPWLSWWILRQHRLLSLKGTCLAPFIFYIYLLFIYCSVIGWCFY